jgi:hypothetical protein
MKNIQTRILFLLVLVAAIVILLFAANPERAEFVKNMTSETYNDIFFTYQVTRYESGAEVSNRSGGSTVVGITVDPWNLKFGIIPTGGSSGRRSMVLSNLQEKAGRVEMQAYGNITPMIEFEKNNFMLQKNESVKIEITFKTAASTAPGNYTGEIDVVIKKPRYDFLYSLLGWSQ